MNQTAKTDGQQKKKRSFILPIAIVGIIAFGALFRTQVCTFFTGEISGEAVAKAQSDIAKIVSSAQNSFIHRRNDNRRLATSIEELGNGFSSNGALIYGDIWIARFGRNPQEDGDVDPLMVKDALASPYRYAVLPVSGLFGEADDARTTCVLALPVSKKAKPLLAMVAGPIRRDPADFLKSWPTHEIRVPEAIDEIRAYAIGKKSVDRHFLELLESASSHQPVQP